MLILASRLQGSRGVRQSQIGSHNMNEFFSSSSTMDGWMAQKVGKMDDIYPRSLFSA